jgi:hypothetical protein
MQTYKNFSRMNNMPSVWREKSRSLLRRSHFQCEMSVLVFAEVTAVRRVRSPRTIFFYALGIMIIMTTLTKRSKWNPCLVQLKINKSDVQYSYFLAKKEVRCHPHCVYWYETNCNEVVNNNKLPQSLADTYQNNQMNLTV